MAELIYLLQEIIMGFEFKNGNVRYEPNYSSCHLDPTLAVPIFSTNTMSIQYMDSYYTLVRAYCKTRVFFERRTPRAKTRPILALIILCFSRFRVVVVVDYQTILDHDSCHIYVSNVEHLQIIKQFWTIIVVIFKSQV